MRQEPKRTPLNRRSRDPWTHTGPLLRIGPLGVLALALLAPSCLKREIEPFRPLRPYLGTDSGRRSLEVFTEPFPERSLTQARRETPPRTLLRVEEIFRQIGSLPGPEPEWRLPSLEAEIDSIEAAAARLGLGPAGLLRARWGSPREDEKPRLRQAALLEMRHGLALMRTGDVTRRVWGAERLRKAMEWLPEEPLLLLVYAAYQEIGQFWSNEISLLENWLERQGPSDLVELQLLRKRERMWKVERDRDQLNRAFTIADRMARRAGGWGSAPSWLLLERARLHLEADSVRAAGAAARRARELCGSPPSDTLTAVQAELLLGIVEVRALEYERAGEHFARARALGSQFAPLGGLVSWMQVPWDLMTSEERESFDRDPNRNLWLERYWRGQDPILATPNLQENRIEYERRVGESWFALGGIDPTLSGPLTDPGQAFLRFGRPDEWISVGGQMTHGFEHLGPDYAIQHTWRFRYDLPDRPAGAPMWIVFQDHGTVSRFSAVDSMAPPRFPMRVFRQGFDGRTYRYESSVARLRQADGRIRLLLYYDVFLPDYSIRFPMQGLVFRGEGRVRTTVYKARGKGWVAQDPLETTLDRERLRVQGWTFRRRAGFSVLSGLEAGPIWIATQFHLRDAAGRIVGAGVDNGNERKLDPFDERALQASDLILLDAPPGELPADPDREPRPGWKVSGPDLFADSLQPRASRVFLEGEPIAWYLEVYGLDVRRGLADAEASIALDRLKEDGSEDYSVSTEGLTQRLVRFGVRQWNVASALRLTHLTPGFYRLRIRVTDLRAEQDLSRRVVFRVATPDEVAELYAWATLPAPEPEPKTETDGGM